MNPDEPRSNERRRAIAWVSIPLLLTAFVHRQVLGLFFSSDDFLHLYQLCNGSFLDFITTAHGGHLYWARNSIWYALYSLFGVESGPYFAFVFALHLTNIVLLFLLAKRLSESFAVSTFIASLWGSLPVALGSMAWFSAFGHVLIATCFLWILLDVARLHRTAERVTTPTLLRWLFLLVVAATSYGIGLAFAICFSVMLFLLLDRAPNRRFVVAFFAVMSAVIPLAFKLATEAGGPAISPFWPLESTESFSNFVAFSYDLACSSFAYVCLGPLASRTELGLSNEQFLTVSNFAFPLFLVGLALAYVRASSERRKWMIAMTLVACSIYAMIALGRYVLMNRMPLAAATPRYHYVGTLAFATALCAVLPAARGVGRAAWVGLGLLLVSIGFASSADAWLPDHYVKVGGKQEYRQTVRKIRSEVEAAPAGGTVLIKNRPFRSVHLLTGKERFPGWAGIYVITFPTDKLKGRTVRFLETKSLVRKEAERIGGRIEGMLVEQ